MEWPRPYYVNAKEQQASTAGTNQSATDFVVPAKEWEGLQVHEAKRLLSVWEVVQLYVHFQRS